MSLYEATLCELAARSSFASTTYSWSSMSAPESRPAPHWRSPCSIRLPPPVRLNSPSSPACWTRWGVFKSWGYPSVGLGFQHCDSRTEVTIKIVVRVELIPGSPSAWLPEYPQLLNTPAAH